MSTHVFEQADPSASATTIVATAGLHRRYGEGAAAVDALAGIDVAIRRGELTAIMGASGSGQVDAHACHGRPGHADRRNRDARRSCDSTSSTTAG